MSYKSKWRRHRSIKSFIIKYYSSYLNPVLTSGFVQLCLLLILPMLITTAMPTIIRIISSTITCKFAAKVRKKSERQKAVRRKNSLPDRFRQTLWKNNTRSVHCFIMMKQLLGHDEAIALSWPSNDKNVLRRTSRRESLGKRAKDVPSPACMQR